MVSLIASPYQLLLSRSSFHPVNPSAVVFVSLAARRFPASLNQNQAALKRGSQFVGVVRRCKRSENEDYSVLEEEVLEFMLHSDDPDRFPSRKELIQAGRRDLAEAIVKRGGWMTRGWDLVSDDESEKDDLDGLLRKWNSISAKLGQRQENRRFKEICPPGWERAEVSSAQSGSVNPFSASYPPTSSSERSVEIEADENAGIEGILSRLDKQRNLSFGLSNARKDIVVSNKQNQLHSEGSEDADSNLPWNEADAGLSPDNNSVSIQEKKLSDSNRTNNLKSLSDIIGLRNSPKPDTWRTWSMRRAGFSSSDFEAAEINFDRSGEVISSDSPKRQIISLHKDDKEESLEAVENFEPGEKYSGDKIRSRLNDLELELSSALHALRLNSGLTQIQKVDHERVSEDYINLSDKLEFQENEIMNSQNQLRSLRARLAVLEGKVALTKLEKQKVIDEKLNRIKDSRKTLQLLRTTCVVWPNPASEVLLTGSFDGWATQRKMERSSNGIFSLSLTLYPGTYEFKFIVDGVWKLDPLRPIVKNNGNENNQLIIA